MFWLLGILVSMGWHTRVHGGQVSVGNAVFRDANGDGRYDAGEGVPNVEVQIFTSGTDPSVGTPVATTFTDSAGKYLFLLLDDGQYFVHIPASEFQLGGDLVSMLSLWGGAGEGADDDVGEDGLDEFAPALTGISTADFAVAANEAPTGATGETGFDSASDDLDDANTDLTIDLGFFMPVGVGNLVFIDTDGNGHADPGEGVPGVIVRLFRDGDDPELAIPVSEVTTDTAGQFLFLDIPEGDYFLQVPASEFGGGHPLHGATALPGTTPAADDDAGDDTIDSGDPAVAGARSGVFNLTAFNAPTNGVETGTAGDFDDFADDSIDLTRDLGFALPANWVGVGNLVFIDADGNGHADPNEGIDEIVVQLFNDGDDPQSATPVAEQVTANGGLYFFGNLQPGSYFVHVPASQFAANGPLEGMLSLPGADNGFYDDDGGEDGQDAEDPSATGVSSLVFQLAVGTEPVASTIETGEASYADDFFDNAADLTIDFGFREAVQTTMGVGNLVWVDANSNSHYDAGEGVAGVALQLFRAVDDPQIGTPVASTVTAANGSYSFANLPPDSYYIRIPASQFAAGGPLHGKQSLPGNGDDDGLDDDVDENGLDAADPDLNGLLSTTFTLGNNQEPVDGGTETGFNAVSDNTDDNNTDLTIDLGFEAASPPLLSIGNLVFFDANNNGRADTGEGIDGVAVWLFHENDDPATSVPFLTTETANGGQYLFSGLVEGKYRAFIPPAEFLAGESLEGKISMPGAGVDVGFDDNVEEDGIDGPFPELSGVQSGLIHLQNNLEPIDAGNEKGLFASSDNGDDNNGDLTIDFGFILNCPTLSMAPPSLDDGIIGIAYAATLTGSGGQEPYTWSVDGALPPGLSLSPSGLLSGTPTLAGSWSFSVRVIDGAGCSKVASYSMTIFQTMSLGNLVFVDSNWNGIHDGGEGISGVTLELYHGSDTPGSDPPVATTTSAGGGLYLFTNVVPGDYVVHVPKEMFEAGGPLSGKASLPGVSAGTDDDYGEDGQDAADPAVTGVSTAAFTLANNWAPTDGGIESGIQASSDNADDANGDLTVDFGFREPPRPSAFVAWQAQNPLSGSNGPDDNPDADGSSNLLEYALGLPAESGLNGPSNFHLDYDLTVFHFDAVFSRPLGGLQDATFTLEGISDLSQAAGGWQALGIVPDVTNNGDGTETVRFKDLASDSIFLGGFSGLVRLRIDLDANHDLTPEATAYSSIWVWAGTPLQVLPQTLSLPMMNDDVFTGTVSSVVGSSLDVAASAGSGDIGAALEAGFEYYVEVLDGDEEGHRFDVVEGDCTAGAIALDPASSRSTQAAVPASLAGAKVVLRKHWRVKDALPREVFHATNNASTADRLLFYDRGLGTYRTLWLFSNSGNPKWVLLGDGSLADSGVRVIDACEGFYANPRSSATTVPMVGVVRANDVICPLVAGNNFVGGFWPDVQSPADRLMTVANGFTGSNSQANADKVRIWNGDSTTNQTYTGYYLLKTATLERWVREGDAQLNDQSNSPIFTTQRASFIISKSGKPLWKIPNPLGP